MTTPYVVTADGNLLATNDPRTAAAVGSPWPGWPPQTAAATGWAPADGFGKPFIIVNPSMHIINLSTRTKSSLVKFAERFRNFSEKWFSHILLLMVLFLYASFGAWIMMMVEGGVEQKAKAPVVSMKDRMKRELWFYTSVQKVNKRHLYQIIDYRLQEFEEQLTENFKHEVATDSDTVVWSFWASFVYCFTVFTTIGYGHIAPVTTLGRAFTMGYAFIGIPLLLMVLADLGKLFTRFIKNIFKYARKIFFAKRLKKVRKAGRRATMVPQLMTDAWDKIQKEKKNKNLIKDSSNQDLLAPEYYSYASNSNRASSVEHSAFGQAAGPDRQQENENPKDNEQFISDKSRSKSPESLLYSKDKDVEAQPTETTQVRMLSPTTPYIYPGMQTAAIRTGPLSPPILITTGTTPQPGSRPGTPLDELPEKVKHGYEVDDEFNIPVSLALLILVLYMLAGAVIFSYTDDWSLFDSFYFVYISISTIGFGDMTPETELTLILASVYLLFGLALTSMVINVIQEKLAEVFEETKLRLAVKMGMDAQQMMAEQMEKDQETSEKNGKNSDKSGSKSSLDSKSSKSSGSSSKKKDKEDKKQAKKAAKEQAKQLTKSGKPTDQPAPPAAATNQVAPAQPSRPRVGFSLINEDIGRRMKDRRNRRPGGVESPTSVSSVTDEVSSDDNLNRVSDSDLNADGRSDVDTEPDRARSALGETEDDDEVCGGEVKASNEDNQRPSTATSDDDNMTSTTL